LFMLGENSFALLENRKRCRVVFWNFPDSIDGIQIIYEDVSSNLWCYPWTYKECLDGMLVTLSCLFYGQGMNASWGHFDSRNWNDGIRDDWEMIFWEYEVRKPNAILLQNFHTVILWKWVLQNNRW
jgi:hypothetical protein